ncbi:E3 ubiquitin-protein ligase PUB23-like [Corylus avellana]|uniref:E3 ubiquitin-protein ligase PUB23-like n=1 Tax=Corylus avellana TaxID=13451 RepID=UPI001E22FF95|nr:E3 ubiquitin-protein ligase PUB23-like [Corylus avellana]
MDEIDVPPFFLCPISLELMKDPVTVSTGITYDRENIEKWLFSGKNNTCPITKQPLSAECDLTPNHTLRRLIQSWCTANASHGIERIPTPKPPISKIQIAKLFNNAKSTESKIKCLQNLHSLAFESAANKRCMEATGAVVDFLASIVSAVEEEEEASNDDGIDKALSILSCLQLSDAALKKLTGRNGEFIKSLTRAMQRGSYETRAHAVLLLKSMMEVAEPMEMISLETEFFVELVHVLHDQGSNVVLKLLIQLCPWGRNRVKAVKAGAVTVLIELLLDCFDRRACEMTLVALYMLCGCAEGRVELLGHAAGLAIVSKKILRVSQVASEKAVSILFAISKFSATPAVVQEMLQLGVVAKLCMMLQVECGSKAKEKAKEILILHASAWKSSSCIPKSFLSSYPS